MHPEPQPNTRDPLEAYMAGAFLTADRRPIPLVDTHFTVRLEAGLARVETNRKFRNPEDRSIEVSITFPVPVHAVLFRLAALIDGRLLVAHAKRREDARNTYEAAVDSGHTAVLHEEVLKGVHMLSLMHVPPGAEIEVQTIWAVPLVVVGDRGTLRIPLTVGDIYGCSPLNDGDDLVSGGAQLTGRLRVEASQPILLHGRRLPNGKEVAIPLNRPIDLSVPLWSASTRCAEAHDGSVFKVTLTPAPQLTSPIRLAVMVDCSGSMNELASLIPGKLTKHEAVQRGLSEVARILSTEDQFGLWQFSSEATCLGIVTGGKTPDTTAISNLGAPSGGTEIGRALQRVVAQEPNADILLITDGKSHALDVTALARHQRRIAVLLIGEDSLEANVGHLAAITGGDVFVASGEGIAQSLHAAIASLRRVRGPSVAGEVERSGTIIAYERMRNAVADAGQMNDALAAIAVAFELKDLSILDATGLAERNGLVTHLTSLVLVDEAGGIQSGLPAQRKVALPSPATSVSWPRRFLPELDDIQAFLQPELGETLRASHWLFFEEDSAEIEKATDHKSGEPFVWRLEDALEEAYRQFPAVDGFITLLASKLDWTADPDGLANGQVDSLIARRSEDQEFFEELLGILFEREGVVELARELGKTPLQVVILMLAYAFREKDRTAERLLRGIGGPAVLSRLAEMVQVDYGLGE